MSRMQETQPILSKAAATLAAEREALREACHRSGDWRRFPKACSGLADAYFRHRLEEIWPAEAGPLGRSPFCLVAVGGYGREELCLHSDIDILIVYEKTLPPHALNLAQSLFFPLWDLRLDLGHGFRNFSDCVSLAKQDFQVLASLLDIRFLAGNGSLYDRFQRKLESAVFQKRQARFAEWLKERSQARLHRFGDASALLEPNIKDGQGGLRDCHSIRWLLRLQHGPASLPELAASGRISRAEARTLAEHIVFLMELRNHLHDISGRKNDILYFEYQEEVAKRLGFSRSGEVLAVEAFLAALHKRLADIKVLLAHFWSRALTTDKETPERHRIAPGIHVLGEEIIFSRGVPAPEAVAAAFEAVAREGLTLSWEARGDISSAVTANPSAFSSPAMFESLLRTMTEDHACDAMTQMLETGHLGVLVPEFGHVQYHMQFDAYHTHPVGRHSVAALQHLLHLREERDPDWSDLLAGLAHPERLFLAALLHDIGKGSGQDHSVVGARLAQDILRRFGADPDTVRDVSFLVERHLLLAETASRRDLSDEAVILDCAAAIADEERLNMLHLLTWADSRATGPKAWNDWQMTLRSELYAKLRRVLRNEHQVDDGTQRIMGTRAAVRAEAERIFTPEQVEEFLENMPPRCAMTLSPEEIVRHFSMLSELRTAVEEDSRMMTRGRGGQGVIVLQAARDEAGKCWRLDLAAHWSQAHFSTITGVLALHDLNILSAEIFVWRDGSVVSVVRVSDPPDPVFVDETWQRVRRSYRYAMTGKLSLNYRLAEKRQSPLHLYGPKLPSKKPSVTIDNGSSDFHTLIEVRADDRIGLLHDIATALQTLQLEVQLAKIATHGDQILDVFYVRDCGGQKVDDPGQLREIEGAILFSLGRG